MKGCLITMMVIAGVGVLVLAGGTCYVGVQFQKYLEEMEAALAEARATDQQFPFTPPGDGLLAADRLQQFLQIRRTTVEPLLETFNQIQGRAERQEGLDKITHVFDAVKDVRRETLEAPRRLSHGLREHGMGFSEYRWITEVVHGTLAGADRKGDSPEATAMVDAFEDFSQPEGGGEVRVGENEFDYSDLRHDLERRYTDYDPANLRLILEHKEALQEPMAQVSLDLFLLNPELDRREE